MSQIVKNAARFFCGGEIRGRPRPVDLAYALYESKRVPDVPPLVVMHGLLGSKNNWNSLCKMFVRDANPQRDVLAVDARNHGSSPRTETHTYEDMSVDVVKLLDNLRVPRASFLGHSMGGRTAMMLALTYPKLVQSLIVADVSPVSVPESALLTKNYLDAMQNVRLDESVPLPRARRMADAQLSETVADQKLRAFLLTNLFRRTDGTFDWRLNFDCLEKNFDDVMRFPEVDDLAFRGPVLFVTGGSSDYVREKDRAEITRLFPEVTFEIIDGAGHWLHGEKPEEFARIVVEFLNDFDA